MKFNSIWSQRKSFHMNLQDLIRKKRDKGTFSTHEIKDLVQYAQDPKTPDYQISALLMAIYLNGMTADETSDLTMAMAQGGQMIDLSHIEGVKVDKHSTGGVGDKTTLIVAPWVASLGIPIAKFSGKGLGHTGGTLDKLSVFEGFDYALSANTFVQNIVRHSIAISGQTAEIVPADRRMYALRDLTATVDSIPLIASSIMSKKIASGAEKIVLDVKVGSGASINNMHEALALSQQMVDIGHNLGRETVAIITDMNTPLGAYIGNALEVYEAIEVLQGRGDERLCDLCLEIARNMVQLAKKEWSTDKVTKSLTDQIQNGAAFEKLKELVSAQQGDMETLRKPESLLEAEYQLTVYGQESGILHNVDARIVGLSSMIAGAGRKKKEDAIDLTAGVILQEKIGSEVQKGDILAIIQGQKLEQVKEGQAVLKNAFSIDASDYTPTPLIHRIIRH